MTSLAKIFAVNTWLHIQSQLKPSKLRSEETTKDDRMLRKLLVSLVETLTKRKIQLEEEKEKKRSLLYFFLPFCLHHSPIATIPSLTVLTRLFRCLFPLLLIGTYIAILTEEKKNATSKRIRRIK